MSRQASYIGLTEKARYFLEKNCARWPEKTCKECGHKTSGEIICKVYQKNENECDPFVEPALFEYTMRNGKVYRSIIQCCPWASGPIYFECLQDENGIRRFMWSEKEMEKYL